MTLWKAALFGGVGMLVGFAVGYAVWGQPTTDLQATLARVSAELATTKVWLWDEIRTSDERYDRVSTTLTKTLGDLTKARAELERIRATYGTSTEVTPNTLPAHMWPRRAGDATDPEPQPPPRGVPASLSPTSGSR